MLFGQLLILDNANDPSFRHIVNTSRIFHPSVLRNSFLLRFFFSGEAEAIVAKAQATAKGITMVSQALKEHGGVEVRT